MATPPKNKANRFGLFGGFKGSKSQKQKPKDVRLAEKEAKKRKKQAEKLAKQAGKPPKVKTGKTPTSKIPTISKSTPKLTSKDYKPHFAKKREKRKVKIIGKLKESLPEVIEPSTAINTGNKKLDKYVKDTIDNWYEGPLNKDDVEGIEKRKKGLTIEEITSIIAKDLDIDSVTNLNLGDEPGEKPFIELDELEESTANFIRQNNKAVGPTGDVKQAIGIIPGDTKEKITVTKATPIPGMFKPDGEGGYEPLLETEEVTIQQDIGQDDRVVLSDSAGNIETQANQGQEYTLPELEVAITKDEISKFQNDAYWNSQVQKYKDDWYDPEPSTLFEEEVFTGPNNKSFESALSNLPSMDDVGNDQLWEKFNESEFRAYGFKYENGKLYADVQDENVFNDTERDDVFLNLYDGEPLNSDGEVAKSIDIDFLFLPIDLDNMDGLSISQARNNNINGVNQLKKFLKENKKDYNRDYDDSENLLNIEEIYKDQQRVSNNLMAQIDQLQADLANSNVMQNKKDIEDKVSSLKQAYTEAMLDAFTDKKISKQQMEDLKDTNKISEYNRLVPSYNAKLDYFNNLIEEYTKKPFSNFDTKKVNDNVIVTSPETGVSITLNSDLILEEQNNNLPLLEIISNNEDKFNEVVDKIVDYQDKLNYLQALIKDNEVILGKQLTTLLEKIKLQKKQDVEGSIADYVATLLNRIKDTFVKLPAGIVELMLQGLQAAALATSREEFANKMAESIVRVVEGSEEIMRALDIKPGDDKEFDKFNQDFQASRVGQVEKALVELIMDIYTMKGGISLLGKTSKLRKTKLLKLLKSKNLTRPQKIGQIGKALLNINLPMMSRTAHDFKFEILNYRKKGRLVKMTPTEEIILSTGLSYAISLLDKIGIDAMATPGGKALTLRLINSMFKKGVTTREALNNVVKKFAAQKLFSIPVIGATEVSVEVTQEEVERLTRQLYNSLKNLDTKQGFEVAEFLSDQWKENTADVVWVSLMTVGAYSGFNAAVEIATKANDINELKKQNEDQLKSYLQIRDPQQYRIWKAIKLAELKSIDSVTQEQIDKVNEEIKQAEKIHNILQKIPADLNVKDAKEAFDLMLNKSELEEEIENLDPSLAAAKIEELKGTDEKLKQLALQTTVEGEFDEEAETIDKKVDPTIKSIRESAKKQEQDYPDATIIVAKNPIEAEEKAQEVGTSMKGSPAKFYRDKDGKQYFIYDEQTGLIIGENKADHEDFHKIVDDIERSTGDESSTFAMANAIINEIENGNITVENSKYLDILKKYEEKGSSDLELADEIIANFIDAVKYDDNVKTSLTSIKNIYKKSLRKLYNKLPKSLKSKLPNLGTIKFEKDSDFIDYLKDFAKGDRTPFEPIVDEDAETKFKTKVKPTLGIEGTTADKTDSKDRAATTQENIEEKTNLINKIKDLTARKADMVSVDYTKQLTKLQKRVKVLNKGIQNAQDVATIEDPNSGIGAKRRAENSLVERNKGPLVQEVINKSIDPRGAIPVSEIKQRLEEEFDNLYSTFFKRDASLKDSPFGIYVRNNLSKRLPKILDDLSKELKNTSLEQQQEKGDFATPTTDENIVEELSTEKNIEGKNNMRKSLGILPGSKVFENTKQAVIKTFRGKPPTIKQLKKSLQDSYATELVDDIKEMVQDIGAENFLRTYGEEMYNAIDQANMNKSFQDFTIQGKRLGPIETRKAVAEGLIPFKTEEQIADGVYLYEKAPYNEDAWVNYHLNPTKGTKYTKLNQLYAVIAKNLGKDATMEVIQQDDMMDMYNERNKIVGQAEVTVEEIAREIQRDPKDRFALNPDKSAKIIMDAVTEAMNNGADMSAWETAQIKIPKDLRDNYEDIFIRLNDLFGEVQQYKQKVRDMNIPTELQDQVDEYFKVNTQVKGKITKEGAEQMHAFNEKLLEVIDPTVLKAVGGVTFLGYIYGYLDGGKKDKAGTIFGPYKKQLDDIKKKIEKSKVQDNLDFNPEDIRLINSGYKILNKAENILKKDISIDAKYAELGLVDGKIVPGGIIDQLQKADIANKKAFNYITVKSAEILADNPSLIPGYLRLLETSANNTKGWRALSGVSLIQKPTEQSQSVYFEDDKEQGINTDHPYFKLAEEVTRTQFSIKAGKKGGDVITAEAFEEKLAENLKFKGEHISPVSGLNAKIAENVLKTVSKLRKAAGNDIEKEAILKTLSLETDLMLANYDQVVGVKAASELIDIIGGTTSSADYARLLIDGGFNLDNYFSIKDPSLDANTVVQDKILPEKVSLEENTNNQLQPKERNAKTLNDSKVEQVDSKTSNPEILGKMTTIDKVLTKARTPNEEVKKIRVFDFDDTVARSNSLVFYTMPDGTKGELTAEEFATDGSDLLAKGAEFDFTDFNIVRDGKKGPLFELLKKMKETPGDRDLFILTARAPESEKAIQAFLKSQGVDLPLENIVGLGNSSPFAKSNWMAGKIAEGYNDIYFADDAKQNVDAMKDLVEVADVKSKVQQAKERFALDGQQIADQLFRMTAAKNKKLSEEALRNISEIKAEIKGSKVRDDIFMAASAQNFTGLLYRFLGKGTEGDADYEFLKDNLVAPYTRALNEINGYQNALISDHKQLVKTFVGNGKPIKNLQDEVPGLGGYTYQDMIRILAWDSQGITIEGLPVSTLNSMKDLANSNESYQQFADQLVAINKGDGYYYPGNTWRAGTILGDLLQGVRLVKRPKALQEWKDNIEIIFGEYKNGKYNGQLMNAIQATYGTKFREALEDMLQRMTTGMNRKQSQSRLENQFFNWLNNSVGAVMFFNMRSGLLQTLSSVNYINWTFNNPAKAAVAFANQKQYWKDFMELMNSDFLVDRRAGLKINISESEIFDAASTSKDKASAIINTFLRAGFSITQVADSFAIASGGATFYRNRIKDLLKQGKTESEAKKQAYDEWTSLSREAQQSSDALEVSAQQAGGLGRVILAFANTPMQYNRIIYKAFSDIKNGRGDLKTNLSRIAYYGALQNLMFNALQQAVFAVVGSEDEEEINEKELDVLNGMLDSLLRGMGISGSIIAALKDIGVDIYDRSKKPRPEYVDAVFQALNISPPLDVKVSKAKRAGLNYDYNRKTPEASQPFNIDNPAYMSTALVVAATTNFPLDRILQKIYNVRDAMKEDQENWKRIFLLLGWSEWQLNSKQENEEIRKLRLQRIKAFKSGTLIDQDYKPVEATPPATQPAVEEVEQDTTPVVKQDTTPRAKVVKQQAVVPKPKKVTFTENKSFKNNRVPTNLRNADEKKLYDMSAAEQRDSLAKLGLSKAEIKALKYEGDRVRKIIELQK